MCGHVTFSKGAKTTQRGKDSLFNKQCLGNCTSPCKRLTLEPYLTPYAEINLVEKDLNGGPKNMKEPYRHYSK